MANEPGPSIAEQRAHDLLVEAEKKQKGWSLFNSQAKYEDAAELYTKAAAQFKIAKLWQEAGDAYVKAAELYETKSKSETDAVRCYTDAAKSYKNTSPADAIRVYNIAVAKNMENNKFSVAAKLYKDLAELLESEMKTDDAMKAYEKSAECYFAEDSITSGNQMMLRVADFAAQKEDYKRAIEIYEKTSRASADNNLTRWSVPDYLFKASLCALALDAKSNIFDSSFVAIKRYLADYPLFTNAREGKMCDKLIPAIEQRDAEQLTDIIAEYDQVSPLDNFKSGLLLIVKKCLIEKGGESFV